jgi:DNA polymerase III subunit delta
MVAIAAKDADSFVKKDYARFFIILLYGPDEGLVSERAEHIARATTGNDLGNILRFDGDEIAADPLRLADEANAISMFGGIRAIRLKAGSKALTSALELLLTKPPQDARIIIEAGDIKPAHALRSLLEKAAQAAVLPCYGEDNRDVGKFLETMLVENGFSISADAKQLLIQSIGVDRKRSRMEIEKLFLYCHGFENIKREDVEAVITDAAALSVDTVIDATFLGQLATIEFEARRVFADGLDASVLLGFALRHALLLQSIRRDIDSGRNATESIKASRVMWKRERVVTDQVSRWSEARLSRAIQIIGDAVLNVRRTAPLAEAIAIRSLWSLALSVSKS